MKTFLRSFAKKALAPIALGILLFQTLPSHSTEEETLEAQCFEKYLDHGITLKILGQGASTNGTAILAQVTYSDTYLLGNFQVTRPRYPEGQPAGAELNYLSDNEDFTVTLKLLTDAGEEEVAAEGLLKAKIINLDGHSEVLEKEIFCHIFRNAR